MCPRRIGRRVLVQEWVEGEKGPWMEDGEKLLTIGLQCSVLQVLDSGETFARASFVLLCVGGVICCVLFSEISLGTPLLDSTPCQMFFYANCEEFLVDPGVWTLSVKLRYSSRRGMSTVSYTW